MVFEIALVLERSCGRIRRMAVVDKYTTQHTLSTSPQPHKNKQYISHSINPPYHPLIYSSPIKSPTQPHNPYSPRKPTPAPPHARHPIPSHPSDSRAHPRTTFPLHSTRAQRNHNKHPQTLTSRHITSRHNTTHHNTAMSDADLEQIRQARLQQLQQQQGGGGRGSPGAGGEGSEQEQRR